MKRAPGRSARQIGLWAALVAAVQVSASPARADGLPIVALDLSGLSSMEHRQLDGVALENRVVVRLLQEGFTVAAPQGRDVQGAAAPGVVIRVSLSGGDLRLWYVDAGRQDERFVRWTRGEPLPELHWVVAQKVVELARTWRNAVQARAALAIPAAPAPPAGASSPLAPEAAAPATPWRLGAGFGARSRDGGADPVVTGAWSREGVRWSLEGRAQGSWSRAHSLSEQDLELLLGVSRRWPLLRRWALDAALLVGPGLHHYSSSLAGDPHPSGLQLGLVLSPELALSVRGPGALELSLRVAPGMAWPAISHTRAGETLWRRTPFRLEAGVTVRRRFE